MTYVIEYSSWLVTQLLNGWAGLYIIALVVTLGLQAARTWLSGRHYLWLWGALLPVGLVWGGWALWEYLPNFFRLYETYFAIPGVIVAVGIAKLQQVMKLRWYVALVAGLLLVIFLAYLVMHPYQTGEYRMYKGNPWNRWPVTFQIHEWLSGRDWNPPAPGGGGGGGGGGLGTISWRTPSLEWIFFRSPGIPFLASVLAVPPRRIRKAERSSDGANGAG